MSSRCPRVFMLGLQLLYLHGARFLRSNQRYWRAIFSGWARLNDSRWRVDLRLALDSGLAVEVALSALLERVSFVII